MKNLFCTILFTLCVYLPLSTFAASSGQSVDPVDIDLFDQASLQRGAKTFVDYCLSCHAAKLMRYNRLAKDIGMTEQEVKNKLIFGHEKIVDPMTVAMRPEDANKWFGIMPPDLSVIARARGTDWLYSYLRSFYLDDAHYLGTNNLFFKDVGMPHVFWQQQGYQTKNNETNQLTSLPKTDHQPEMTDGTNVPITYDETIRDLVNFLAYISEPSKIQRLSIGKWVLLYLVILFILAYAMKKAYWKDIH